MRFCTSLASNVNYIVYYYSCEPIAGRFKGAVCPCLGLAGADPGFRRGGGGFVQEFRLENRSYPDVHDFSLRMQVIIAND